MNAGERELQWIKQAYPHLHTESCQDNWMYYIEKGNESDNKLVKDWSSFVPGSQAPCHLIVAAIQCMRNKGYDVTEAELYIEEGLKAAQEKDGAKLQRITAKIYQLLNQAPKDEKADYWQYQVYRSWEEIKADSRFPVFSEVNVNSEEFAQQIRAGWYGQLIGGALGTQIEGYTTANIREIFGEVRTYLRSPETYNDDITYELAFLQAFSENGYDVTSEEIADQWLELIAEGYSAEEVALRNLRNGITPPVSGQYLNYYSDWIGAQMRTAVHGMAAPGNPELAAKLAAYDSVISHSNNGLLGGVFNAVLVSLSFVEKDTRKLVCQAIDCIPPKSEYYSVLEFALHACEKSEAWEEAWAKCEVKYEAYNWVHAYPNAAAEVVALWYGNNDFDETAFIITMEGQDVDCTAAPILNILGIINGISGIKAEWIEPLGTEIQTIMRKYKKISFEELCKFTVDSIRRANASR